jgi:ABC-2 type transport system ATP-binding protein
MNSIEVRNLTKKFGEFTAVHNISFDVSQGEVFGFLGANGAGKSTAIKMLCAILEPTSGNALVGGFSIKEEPDKIKRIIGYMSQKFSLYNDLTVEENINFFGGIYGLKNNHLIERKKWALRIANLEGREKTLTHNLSAGFKQRLALGCSVLHEPKIVFLDEPTGGVDPISRRNFWELINDLSQKGITVFVTTHYLDEAEYCNRIMMIDAGKLIAGGSPKEIKTNYLNKTILEIECNLNSRAMEILDKLYFVQNTAYFGNYLHISISADKSNQNEIDEQISLIKKALTQDSTVNIHRIDKIVPSLEDVFVNLIDTGVKE